MDERIVKAVRAEGLGARLKDVLIACYDRIVGGEIVSVADLLEDLEELGWDPRLERVVRRSYRLIRELHWGIFRHLDPKLHPELWHALTVSNPTMRDVADLKRNVVVPNVYCAILDVHDYTDFCQKNRHNVSMIRMLDDLMQKDLRKVADEHRCLATRSAGDTIIIIGSSPIDIVRACLGMIASFSRKRVVQVAMEFESRSGKSVAMQDFRVSAGVAGGQHYNSLIVTQDGDISGSVVNTAARLQAFAGTIAPDRSKVMVTSHVHAGYEKEVAYAGGATDGLVFFDCGRVSFKGVGVGVFELLFAEREMKKVRYQREYRNVAEAAARGQWSDQLIPDLTRLVAKVLRTNPISRVEVLEEGMRRKVSNANVIGLCEEAVDLYESAQDHREVSARLQEISAILERASGFDPLVLIHFRQVIGAYDQLVREFERVQYERIIENQTGLFSAKERSLIDHAARLERIRDTLIERGKRDNNIYSPAMLWNKIVHDFDDGLEFEVYSGKR